LRIADGAALPLDAWNPRPMVRAPVSAALQHRCDRHRLELAQRVHGEHLGAILPGSDQVQKISIIPGGISALGYTLQLPTEDRFLMTKSELENKVAVLLGGRIAEELIFGEASTGARDIDREIRRIVMRNMSASNNS
jgi:hypothetical protein